MPLKERKLLRYFTVFEFKGYVYAILMHKEDLSLSINLGTFYVIRSKFYLVGGFREAQFQSRIIIEGHRMVNLLRAI